MIDRSVLSKAYLKGGKIAQHQLDSFNYFLEYGMQKIIDEQPYVETSITGEDEKGRYKRGVRLGKITVGNPKTIEAEGSYESIFPSQARVRNLQYSAPIYLGMQLVKKYESRETEAEAGTAAETEIEAECEEEKIEIGTLPIMLKSKRCNLYGLSERELIDKGEDPLDPGGYFILNGSEHVIITLEDLAPNRIFVNFEEKYGIKNAVSKVFSLKQGFRVPTRVEIRHTSELQSRGLISYAVFCLKKKKKI